VTALRPGQCHLWWATAGDAAPSLAALLDHSERQRLERLQRQADRDRFLVGCAVLRLSLAECLAVPVERVRLDRTCPTCGQPHGKPRLVSPPLPVEASVSHAGDRVVVAVALRMPVGVDVELVNPNLSVPGLAGQVLRPAEAAALLRLSPPEQVAAFVTYWTRKEAAVKAIGRGLAMDPQAVVVTAPEEPARLLAWPEAEATVPAGRVELRDLDAGLAYRACLAAIGTLTEILVHDGSGLIAAWLEPATALPATVLLANSLLWRPSSGLEIINPR